MFTYHHELRDIETTTDFTYTQPAPVEHIKFWGTWITE